uniref:Basic-leucine zipper n=1 Tax=Humulus lupulus TaxID=3486 RepID=G7ZLA5_HUMLU|nr:basic-leucine zipper [Humulus lupulus]
MEFGDELIEDIDWNALLEWEPPVLTTDSSASSPSSDPSSWIDEIENLLMKEDDEEAAPKSDHDDDHNDNEFCQNFLADILVDSPGNDSDEAPTVSAAAAENDGNVSSDGNFNSEKEVEANLDNEDADDPVSKKRRRQVRNRDAAVRSRERKKMYVKELEMKSKYLEGECRRLGRLLQCVYAENQALRLSSSCYAFGGSTTTKQESAVLFLESLLLGSLLWLLVGTITCLLTPQLTPPQQQLLLLNQNQEQDRRESRSEKNYGYPIQSFVKSRRCKASWTKMKPPPHFQFHGSLLVF